MMRLAAPYRRVRSAQTLGRMQVTFDQIDEPSLVALGTEAARLVVANDLTSLQQRFGYALAFAREPVTAIAQDLAAALVELCATSLSESVPLEAHVRHFQPNGTGLVGVVECLLSTNNHKAVLLELAVTTRGPEFHVTPEQLSACSVAGPENAA